MGVECRRPHREICAQYQLQVEMQYWTYPMGLDHHDMMVMRAPAGMEAGCTHSTR